MADTILLVDDDAMLRETLALNLRNAGYEVRTAADGLSALQEAQARVPDLVILDLMLPELDGLTDCRTLRQSADVPILMLTARTGELDRIVGLAGNALYATLIMSAARFEPTGALALATASQGIGAPLLSLAYISAICLLALRPAWQRLLRVLAPVGQMALTNYLLESIICTLIFYGYGLGLFGKMGSVERLSAWKRGHIRQTSP